VNLPLLRANYAARCLAAAGALPQMSHVEDVVTPVPARLYTPRPDAARLLVYLHGGRFISGGYDTHDALCRILADNSGWRVLLVDYRLAPEHLFPAALDDTLSALDWASRQAPAVALAGDSAGGNLAAAAAIERRELLSGLLLFYPMLDATCHLPSHAEFRTGPGPSGDDMRIGYDLYLPGEADRSCPAVSPWFAQDLKGFPPAFVFTAGMDSLRDEGRTFAARLANVRAVHYPDCIHGILTLPALHEAAGRALGEAGAWLRNL
jgi:acetyl esterase